MRRVLQTFALAAGGAFAPIAPALAQQASITGRVTDAASGQPIFRVLNLRNDPAGRRPVIGGDGWVIAVEFLDVPKSYSVLAYGQSPREDSPSHSDQAAMFAKGEMKRVLFTEAEIERGYSEALSAEAMRQLQGARRASPAARPDLPDNRTITFRS